MNMNDYFWSDLHRDYPKIQNTVGREGRAGGGDYRLFLCHDIGDQIIQDDLGVSRNRAVMSLHYVHYSRSKEGITDLVFAEGVCAFCVGECSFGKMRIT